MDYPLRLPLAGARLGGVAGGAGQELPPPGFVWVNH